MIGRPGATAGRSALAAAIVGLLLLGLAFAVQLIAELASAPSAAGHHDILAFWAAGRLILEGRPGDLYDATALTTLQRTVIPEPIGMNGYMPFINPPVAAVAFAPLAVLSEPVARVAWAALNVVLVAAAGLWLSRGLPGRERLVATLLVATSFPAYHALAEGQWSIVLLVASLAALAAARRGAWGLAGLAIGVLWLKPQFIVLPLILLVLARRWRAVGAAIATGAIAVIVAQPLTGLSANLTYVGYLVDVVTSHFSGAGPAGGAVWQGDLASTEGLNGLFVGWFGQDAVGLVNLLWAGSIVVLAGLYGLAMRAVRPGFDTPGARRMLAAGIVLVLLVNPNQFVQDCVLIFLALEALWPGAPERRLAAIVVTVALADLTFLDLQVPALHLFPIILAGGLVWACWRALSRAGHLDTSVAPGLRSS
jgi:hypothetical protein